MKTFGPYRGVVDRVVDGDTIHASLDLGFDLTVHARIRIYGINVSHDWDKYGGRVDGDLLVGSLNFGAAMVKAGHAEAWDGKGPKP